jgi:hypothetical protein
VEEGGGAYFAATTVATGGEEGIEELAHEL